jgi:hypothetical protein
MDIFAMHKAKVFSLNITTLGGCKTVKFGAEKKAIRFEIWPFLFQFK